MSQLKTEYFVERKHWRKWLKANFDKTIDIWLEYPKKKTGKPRISYNDAVEEALCFGWIDSTVKSLNETTTIQRFSKRRAKSGYSQANKERLKWLSDKGLIHESVRSDIERVITVEFTFPNDILVKLKSNKTVWDNYQKLSASYRRIRIAYIESARNRPEEFDKRLKNFISKTKDNKVVKGFGGIDKYY